VHATISSLLVEMWSCKLFALAGLNPVFLISVSQVDRITGKSPWHRAEHVILHYRKAIKRKMNITQFLFLGIQLMLWKDHLFLIRTWIVLLIFMFALVSSIVSFAFSMCEVSVSKHLSNREFSMVSLLRSLPHLYCRHSVHLCWWIQPHQILF
jgi:hypothetical protein